MKPSFATWGFPRPLDLFLGCTRPFQGVWSLVCEELYCFGLLILANSTARSLCSFNSTNCNLFLPTTLSFALPIFPFGILLGGWFGPAKDNRKPCVVCVCIFWVFVFHLVFIVFFAPFHPRYEFVKIGPTPRGSTSSYGISSFWLPRIHLRFVISHKNSKIPKNSPKIAFGSICEFGELFVVLIHGEHVLGRGLALFAFP